LSATAIGHTFISGEAKIHIKNLLYSPPLTIVENPQPCLNWLSQNLSIFQAFRGSLPQESTYYDLPSYIVSRIKNQVQLRDYSAKNILEVCHNRQLKKEIHIAVFGGSMTGGAECEEGDMIYKACSWPARLQGILDLAYPHCFRVHNFARGGTQTEVALSSIAITLRSILKSSAGRPAIVITDFSVNDAYEIDGGHLGRMSTLQDTDGGLYEKGAALGEALVRTIRNISGPRVEHLMLLSHCPKCVNDGGLLDGFAAASKFHSVPILDLRQLFPKYREPSKTHPNYRTHELVAELVADAIFTSLHKQCAVQLDHHEATFSDPQMLEKLPGCLEPISVYSAYDHSEKAPLNSSYSGPWRLISDREGKPGWITTRPNSSLTLPVGFGATPALIVNYLKSYEGMGAATLTLNQTNVSLTGLWDKKMSTTVSFVSQAYTSIQQSPAGDDDHYGSIGFGVKPHTFHNLTLTFQSNAAGDKFKLIELITC